MAVLSKKKKSHLAPESSNYKIGIIVQVTVAVMKHHDQNNLERKGLIWLTLPSLFITEGSQDRNSSRAGIWRQELMQRPWRGAAYWLTSRGLLNSAHLVEPRNTCPSLAMVWALPIDP